MEDKKIKILIGSCIYQKINILKEYLISLKELNKKLVDVSYIFIDDNKDKESSDELLNFKDNERKIYLYKGYEDNESYLCDEKTHYWSNNNILKVANYKNFIIEQMIKGDYDYLFLVDSDLILHPETLNRLIAVNKDIVSDIFWTKWSIDTEEMPQVWVSDNYSFSDLYGRKTLDKETIEKEKLEFFKMLRIPGTYKVGGLGACTLIKRNVLEKGVNFSRLYNLSYLGEDRHFCMRAVANNFDLYVDTYYPAYHIYREEALGEVYNYKKNNINRDIDIMGSQLFSLVSEGIKRLNTYGYKGENESYKLFFTESALDEIAKEDRKLKENEVNNCEVLSCNMNFNKTLTTFKGKIEYAESGYKDGSNFYNESIGEVEVINLSNGIWRINKFNKICDKEIEK